MNNQVITLTGINVSKSDKNIIIQAEVTGAPPISFEIPSQFEHLIDHQSVDAFALLYTWVAMEKGSDLHVTAKTSLKLSHSIENKVIPIFRELCPWLNAINVSFMQTQENWTHETKGISTGFSGGIDSLYTLITASNSDIPFTHLLFTNTGQHGKEDVLKIFKERAKIAQKCLGNQNTFLITVNTNIDDIIHAGFQQTHTLRNAACVLILQNGVHEYSYSSGYTDEEIRVKAFHDMAIVDPILLPAFSTERLNLSSTGGKHSRSEKINSVMSSNLFSGKLYVCTEKNIPVKNCSYCFKCRRTQLALHYLGHPGYLKNNFNETFFKKNKSLMTLGLLVNSKNNSSDLEVAHQIYSKIGWRSTPLKYIVSALYWLKNNSPKAIAWRVEKRWPYIC